MIKINNSNAVMIQTPDIESMYKFLFHCFELWKQSDKALFAEFKSNSSNKPTPPLRSASKYSLIIGSYSLLDAVIHSYVSMHHFQTDENEDNHTVYSKWKNFPHHVEGVGFKKNDILIIEKIRLLRNQIAHPKADIKLPVTEVKGGLSMQIMETATGPVIGNINFASSFNLSNGAFLINEVTRLLNLAEASLSKVMFIPKEKAYLTNDDGLVGDMWPEDVNVI